MAGLRDAKAAIRDGVAYLIKSQGADGSYLGHASPYPDDFTAFREHHTVFFTALIACALKDVPGTERIRDRAARFLLSARSSLGAWNYWIPESKDQIRRPFPDDLDDTACAMAAIASASPKLIGGDLMADFASALIGAEVKPGGPYRTWLVGPDAETQWRDVDVAVNANIGYALRLLDVSVPGLEAYVSEALASGELESPYYLGILPTLYFLSRWYEGEEHEKLKRLVADATQAGPSTPLEQALMVSAAARLELDERFIEPLCASLVESAQEGHWPATALYFEPPVDGQLYYAGSEALTTAFVVEALGLAYANRNEIPEPPLRLSPDRARFKDEVFEAAVSVNRELPYAEIRQRYQQVLDQIRRIDADGWIATMPQVTAEAIGAQLPRRQLIQLGAANVLGWAAYTVYDDFFDDEGSALRLGAANQAMRRSLAGFLAAVPGEPFADLTAKVFDRIDGANTWEVTHARAALSAGGVRIASLPRYGDMGQLADRSLGTMLPALGVFALAGFSPDATESEGLKRFFRHYLVARQLNDDAHDWEEDLRHGHLSAVVTMVVRDRAGQVLAERDMPALRQRFWASVIGPLARTVIAHIDDARFELRRNRALREPQLFEAWLEPLERSMREALNGRDQTQAFIRKLSE